MRLRLKVVPGASRDGHEWMDSAEPLLKVRVTAAPEKGKANKAVEKYLADRLGVAAGAVSIVGGATSQQKLVEIRGLAENDILSRLAGA